MAEERLFTIDRGEFTGHTADARQLLIGWNGDWEDKLFLFLWFDADGFQSIDMNGVNNVLKLRAQFEGGTPASPDKYLDLSYYDRAVAGL